MDRLASTTNFSSMVLTLSLLFSVKCFSTYRDPVANPRLDCTLPRQRFHLGGCSISKHTLFIKYD